MCHDKVFLVGSAKEDIAALQTAFLAQAVAITLGVDALREGGDNDVIILSGLGRVDGVDVEIDHAHAVAVDDVCVALPFGLDLGIGLGADACLSRFDGFLVCLAVVLLAAMT